MFRKGKDNKEEQLPTKKFHVKYPKPKILLIDLPDACADHVQSAGYNALVGTFGSPYKVELKSDYDLIIGKPFLPNYTEQEIIFINLTPPETIDNLEGNTQICDGENYWWAKCNRGKIDPRPKFMLKVQHFFDRIFTHGGFFVIFTEPRLSQELIWAKIRHGTLERDSDILEDNWSFLSVLSPDNIEIEPDFGEEMVVPDYDHPIYHFLKKSIKNTVYTATFSSRSSISIDNTWLPILYNKYNGCVAALISTKKSKGRVLILPQISKKAEAVVTLLREVLPELSPHLFPHIEGSRWVERDEYELDSVLIYKNEKIELHKKAKKELEDLDRKISQEREKLGFLHGIITQKDRDLVVSVKSCLELIGFKEIIDVDEQIRKESPNAPKQEDLQINDKSPILLVEVRGLSGLPSEFDSIKVLKYIPRRMQEWNRTDVRGVTLINHQCNTPALERNNQRAFTDQQIEDAKSHNITILTTWDLFLLIRGMVKWRWDRNSIQELFYQSGRMPRIPTIYKPIGKIVNYWEKVGAVGVEICEGSLRREDRIGYLIPAGYLEEKVSSLQIENQDVEEAHTDQLAGIKTLYPKESLRKGTRVYKVIKQ